MILVDTNLLIYAFNESAEENHRARKWLEKSLAGPDAVCFSWQTITAFLRISTNTQVFSNSFSADEAFAVVENWLSAPNSRILVPGTRHLSLFGGLATTSRISGAMLMDAHLAALAIEHGATLATTDRDFRRFDGLKLIDPLARA